MIGGWGRGEGSLRGEGCWRGGGVEVSWLWGCGAGVPAPRSAHRPLVPGAGVAVLDLLTAGSGLGRDCWRLWRRCRDFGDFGVSFVATVAGRYNDGLPFFFFFLCRRKTKVSDRGFESRRRHIVAVCLFFFSYLRRRKTKVSDRELDSRRWHSACETVIAVNSDSSA